MPTLTRRSHSSFYAFSESSTEIEGPWTLRAQRGELWTRFRAAEKLCFFMETPAIVSFSVGAPAKSKGSCFCEFVVMSLLPLSFIYMAERPHLKSFFLNTPKCPYRSDLACWPVGLFDNRR